VFLFRWLRQLYDLVLSAAGHRNAVGILFVVSFAESSFFPVPPDVLLIPMILATPHRAFYLATICTVASVLGGLAGYAIGAFAFSTIGEPIVAFYGLEQRFESFRQLYAEYGMWIVTGAGFTPIPYKLITIASGAADYSLGLFLVASIIGRGARFYLVGLLLWKFGPQIRSFIERYFAWLALAGFLLLVAGFALLALPGHGAEPPAMEAPATEAPSADPTPTDGPDLTPAPSPLPSVVPTASP